MRRRYMITWENSEMRGRDTWKMDRRGKLSPADIIRLEVTLMEKWGLSRPPIIQNIVQIN